MSEDKKRGRAVEITHVLCTDRMPAIGSVDGSDKNYDAKQYHLTPSNDPAFGPGVFVAKRTGADNNGRGPLSMFIPAHYIKAIQLKDTTQ